MVDILDNGYGKETFDKFCNNELEMGFGLGIINIDDYMIWKPANFNVISGHANVGKTYARLWYYTMLALKHGFKFDLFSPENDVWALKQYIANFKIGSDIRALEEKDRFDAWNWVEHHFNFINPERHWTIYELLEVARGTDSNALMVDPINSLSMPENNTLNRHDYDYKSAGDIRIFCKQTGKTVELIGHGVTDALRKTHPKGHDFEGLTMPLNVSDIEGGGKWVNRCDNFYVYHRYVAHPEAWKDTMIHVRKVKVTQTGGKQTMFDYPIRLHAPFEGAFLIGEKDVRYHIMQNRDEQGEIDAHKEFLNNEKFI